MSAIVNITARKLVDAVDEIAPVEHAGIEVAERTSRSPVSLESVVSMRKRGLSFTEIGKLSGGISKQAVSQLMRRHGVDAGTLEAFKSGKADILHSKQAILLNSITEADVAKMKNVRDKAVAFGILYDKCRLEEGLSTNNVISWSAIVSASQQPPEKVIEVSAEEVTE
jgi:DNA-binding Xre family transcriptional regulator